MWLRGTEFRALIIKTGQIVAFIPTDSEGRKRDAVTVRLHDPAAAATASSWLPADRIFYYHDMHGADLEGGFFNERTKEKIRVS